MAMKLGAIALVGLSAGLAALLAALLQFAGLFHA